MMAERVPTHTDDEVGLLVEANKELVLSILRAQAEAADSARVVGELSRTRDLDPLTQLPNRTLLLERIRESVDACRMKRTRFALLFVDLNNFKQVNDTLGLGKPHRVGGHVVRLSASIGISFFPDDGEDAHALIESADRAMYDAKRRDAGHAVLSPSLEALNLPLADYRQALAEQELRLGQMQETNEQLLLAALNAQDLRAAAEAAHRQLTAFLAMMAHELRNPLAPIRNAAALINGVPAEQLPALQAVIERQVAHIMRLVGDVMDVSRVNHGKLHLRPQSLDLTVVVDAAVETCRPAMDVRLQTFTVKMPAHPLMLDGDAVRLTQVLTNLLDNASKYTPIGGRISLSICQRDGRLELSVSDSGIGISSSALSQIFQPFVQDSQAVAFSGSGLGIGLTVVRELVEAHGGTVVASSEGAGQGSQFTVTLPIAAN